MRSWKKNIRPRKRRRRRKRLRKTDHVEREDKKEKNNRPTFFSALIRTTSVSV